MTPRIYVGRFDPRFPGILIRARSVSDVHSFSHHDRSVRAPADVLEHLGDDAIVSDVSRQTVLDHELRHFRDSLLFPFGAATTRARIHGSYNGFLAAASVKWLRGDANILPVPLQQWLRMPEDERKVFLASESAFANEELRPPPLPLIPGDDVTDLAPGRHELEAEEDVLLTACRLALADYARIERLWRSPHTDGEEAVFPAVAAWEAAALICQLAAIEGYAGEPLMQRFIGWTNRSGPKVYRHGMYVLNWVLEQLQWPPTMRNHLAVITWAQMGAYQKGYGASSPASRLGTLIEAAAAGGRWSPDSSFEDLVKQWDALTDTDSFEALRAATTRFSAFCREARGWKYLPAELFTSLATARERMLMTFLSDPDSYVDPVEYLAREADYPLPCVGLEYASENTGGYLTDVTPKEWPSPAVSFDAGWHLEAMASLADAVFLPGEKSLRSHGRVEIAQQLGLRAVRVIR
ncbi:hypothetical protein [Streptomyces sp. NRRL F-2580]|uniref:hypothetical protein n=1 Tax=Streptomyces sp. NRRL F-2580 TaxID=1463841 RepID=UPI00131D4A03|nr:hypothetical protein [Streptomyces sp. NRRL F-2580]